MEKINFDEYTAEERYEIISTFLRKTLAGGSNSNAAERFFEYYFSKYYKIPKDIWSDIIYCQRAMRAHLQVHQLVAQVFAQQADADPVQKNRFLHELESKLYEINAECKYMTMRMQDDIDNFCKVFQEHNVKCNQALIKNLVSHAIVPHVCNTKETIIPKAVQVRESEQALVSRFFTVCEDENKSMTDENLNAPVVPTVKSTQIVATVDITEDDENDVGQCSTSSSDGNTKNSNNFSKSVVAKVAKSDKRKSRHTPATSMLPMKTLPNFTPYGVSPSKPLPKCIKNNKTTPKKENKESSTLAAANVNGVESTVDRVKESRLNLLQVLKRTHSERMRSEGQLNAATVAKATVTEKTTQKLPQSANTLSSLHTASQTANASESIIKQHSVENKTLINDQGTFLRTFGLCSHEEHKRMLQVYTQLKRRSSNKICPVKKLS